jgi:hypothetical protein
MRVLEKIIASRLVLMWLKGGFKERSLHYGLFTVKMLQMAVWGFFCSIWIEITDRKVDVECPEFQRLTS